MKEVSKYNIILMRDDRPVRRLRFKPIWLRFLFYGLCLLVVIAAGGGYFSYNFWQENVALQKSNAELNNKLEHKDTQLKRLQNMQKTFEAYEQKDSRDLLASLQTERSTTDSSMPVDLKEVFNHVDLERIGVENMQARFVGKRLQLQFEINNLVGDDALSGMIRSSLVTRQGKVIEMDIQDSDLDFKIQNFKRIKTSLPIPEDLDKKEVFGIRIIIKNEQKTTIFSETYPLSHIIS